MLSIAKIVIDFILHLDKYLSIIIQNYGTLTYLLLFFVIFMETGFVVTPFLPGDSLIFAAGTLSSITSLNIYLVFICVSLAAILGDTVNYWVGKFIGIKVFEKNSRFFKKKHLIKAQEFYKKYGGKAIVMARFVPIVRTFAPFVAGVSEMEYGKFITFNIVGGLAWVSLFLFGGYIFGNIPFIKQNFHYTVFIIILISLIPLITEWIKAKRENQK